MNPGQQDGRPRQIHFLEVCIGTFDSVVIIILLSTYKAVDQNLFSEPQKSLRFDDLFELVEPDEIKKGKNGFTIFFLGGGLIRRVVIPRST